jgi:GNAT superfamily N-acetyltransferase
MTELRRTDSTDHDFIGLVQSLDAELTLRDGDEHSFYAQFNKVESIKHVVVAYEDGIPLGCGAIKAFDQDTMEVKRMFTDPKGRRKGIAARILNELEIWSRELSYSRCVLETGKRQPEAITLYQKCGYRRIPNYGQYAGVKNSTCFEKAIVK